MIDTLPHIDTIPLNLAVLCVDCNMVSTAQTDGRCVVCGSNSVVKLAKVLNR